MQVSKDLITFALEFINYSFINYVIKFKIDNKKEDITEKELEELLNNYLFNMNKKESYTKKRVGKKC